MTSTIDRRTRSGAVIATLAGAILSLTACQASSSAALSQDTGVSISPRSASTIPGGTVSFAATVSGVSTAAVSWSLKAPGAPAAGAIDANGVYTAPSTTGSFTVVATSAADPTKSASATVAVEVPSSTDPSGLLDSDRVTLWQPGVTYNGGIPARATNCATLSPKGGTQDDTSAIQAAIDACPAGQTVKLNAGTFRINSNAIRLKSNVTLRGSGPGVTTLLSVPSGAGSVIIAGTLWYSYADQRAFTADAAKDAYSVTVDNAAGLLVGEIVSVSETYDPAITYYSDPAQLTGGDYLGWGECRCHHSDGSCRSDSGTGCPAISGWTAQKAMNQSRPIGQVMEIAAINGNTLSFSTPFHTTYRLSRAARLSRFADNERTVQGLPVTQAGVEELTVSDGGGGDDAGPIAFLVASYCWAKHVESTRSAAAAVLFKGAFRCELRDSYIHSTVNPNPGGAGYGIGIDAYSADNLVENNISWAFNKVMVGRSSGGGNVIGYNYMQDGYGAGYPSIAEVGMNLSHMATAHHELFEGNESHNFGSDTTWGNTVYVTLLRNHLTGLRRSYTPLVLTDQGNRRMAEVNTGDRWFSFVGNVLGYSGMPLNASMPGGSTGQTRCLYEATEATGDNDNDLQVWKLTWADQGWNGAPNAPGTSATILRSGNFDWCTQTQKWHGLGGAGTPSSPPSPLPEIPKSFYLAAKPPFMGSNPWPWVDPSTGQTYVLPARARFDAGTPNTLPP